MIITLKICENEKEWETLLEKAPHATIFHSWKFLKIIEKHTKSTLYPLIGLEGTTPVGLYPLFYQKKFILNMVFSPPPHCAVPYLGPVIIDYNVLKQSKREADLIEFQRAVDEFAHKKLKANYILISTPPGLLDSRFLKWNNYQVEPVYNYVIDLRVGIDTIWGQLKKKLRQNINKEKNSQVEIVEGSREDLELVYGLLMDRYDEQARVFNVEGDYLMDVYKAFTPDNIKVLVARYQGKDICGVIDLYYKGKVSSWVGNTKPKTGEVDTIDILQWNAIKIAANSGCTHYEEIGANTERLCKYKSKFNPEPSIHFMAKKTDYKSNAFEKTYINIVKPLSGLLKRIKK